jgi:carotenoid 1,2-hydratase
VTLIAFVGSVFSPYYAWAGRRDPSNHCAVNIALYGRSGARWAMTERGRGTVFRTAEALQIGPSSLEWQDGTLAIRVDEVAGPLPRRIRGTIRVTPLGLPARSFALDAAGDHVWQPIAPKARIAVTLDRPDLSWTGNAYLDSNFGQEPLEAGFRDWTWSRAHDARDAIVLYDARRRDGTSAALALRFPADGTVTALEPPPMVQLPTTGWRLARSTRTDAGSEAAVTATLEDTPFYARTLVKTRLYGEPVDAFHESLSLDRFRSPIVRAMLPFRMPRRVL